MTDNEIIKALECCGSAKGRCYDCLLNDVEDIRICQDKLITEAYRLINRQRAEIERLEAENDILNDKPIGITHIVKDVKVYTNSFKEYYKFENYLKSEAVKEFAEKLKQQAFDDLKYDPILARYVVSVDDIDRLVEEMRCNNG